MSDEHGGHSCAEITPALPELALGILTGRDRAATLAHVESCSPCADELEQLARAADAVVRVAPELEPPVGFEVRLFSRMGVSDDVPTPIRRRVRTWFLASAAAVVALFIGLGAGWALSSPTPGHTGVAVGTPSPGAIVTTAVLREDGRAVGRVSTYGRSQPWMFMTLDDCVDPRRGDLPGGDRRRRDPHGGHVHRQAGLRRLGRAAPGVTRRRASGPGGVAQGDGDRHRHLGLPPLV